MDEKFIERMRFAALFDSYGALLTDKQREYASLYLDDDLSLTEIAAELSISRQAVHDMLHRVHAALEKYETALHWLEIRRGEKKQLDKIYDLLANVSTGEQRPALKLLRNFIDKYTESGKENDF